MKTGKVSAPSSSMVLLDDVFVGKINVTEEITDLLSRLRIDANNLSVEAEEHPLIFARTAVLAEEAQSQANYARRRLDIAKAELDGIIRRDAALEGTKKPTEPQIENQIILDDNIINLTEASLSADRDARLLNVIRQSLIHRREMLAELMRDRRHENGAYNGAGND